MASKKDVDSPTDNSPAYRPLHILSPEDYPRIAATFQKVQVLGGIVASKLASIFTGFYINDINEKWSLIPAKYSKSREDVLVLRLQFTFISRNPKMFSQLTEVQLTNGEIPSPNEFQSSGVAEQ